MAFWNSYEGELHAFRAVFRRHRFGATSYVTKKGFPQMSFSKKIIAGVAAVATLATLAPAVAMAEGDAPATQQQTQAADASITVNSNGGTWAGGARGDVSASGKVGDKFATFASQLPTISRAGYTFAGYSRTKDGSSIISNNDVIIKNWTQLWVAWTKNDAKQFNVTVSTNGGTIADGDHKGEAGDIQVSAAQDSVLVNALPQVQRDGYLFAGWSYDKDGKSPVVATDFVSADTRVYAQWTKADDSKKDDSKPADTTTKNDTKSNTKKTVAQKIKKAVLGNTGATVGGVAAFAVLALLGFAGITVLRKRA